MPERIVNLGPNHRIIVDDTALTWKLQFYDTVAAAWKDIMSYKTDTQRINRSPLLTTEEIADDAVTSAKLHAVKFGLVTIDPPSIAATTTANVDVGVTGLTAGEKVRAWCLGDLEHGLICTTSYCPAANTLRVRITNWTGAAIDGAARTWAWVVFR